MEVTNWRYEIKFSISEIEEDVVDYLLRSTAVPLHKKYDDRLIHSIYYDDYEMNSYLDHIDGVSRRRKFRLRWYNDELDRVTLEIKERYEAVGRKIKFKLSGYDHHTGRDAPLYNYLLEHPESQKLIFDAGNFVPTLKVSYLRTYLTSPLETFMVTIDRNINYRGYGAMTGEIIGSQMPVVIEVKYDHDNTEEVKNFLNRFQIRRYKNSKYVNGIEAVGLNV